MTEDEHAAEGRRLSLSRANRVDAVAEEAARANDLRKCTLCDNLEDPRFGLHVREGEMVTRYPLCDGCAPEPTTADVNAVKVAIREKVRLAREQAATLPRVAVALPGDWADEIAERHVTGTRCRFDLAAALRKARSDGFDDGLRTATLCDHCGAPGKCFGAYEGEEPGYACDDCCGHGQEDGRCIRLEVSDDE